MHSMLLFMNKMTSKEKGELNKPYKTTPASYPAPRDYKHDQHCIQPSAAACATSPAPRLQAKTVHQFCIKRYLDSVSRDVSTQHALNHCIEI
jgi:hypothetical protein